MTSSDSHETTVPRSPDWVGKAQRNVENWGHQEPAALVLAMVEELAEVADELLYQTDGPVLEGRLLLRALVELGKDEVRPYLVRTFEDDDGVPIPPADRPTILRSVRDPTPIREELDDLMPLGLQLQWALAPEFDPVIRQDGFSKVVGTSYASVTGERFEITRQGQMHRFGDGYQDHGPARTLFRGNERAAREVYEILDEWFGDEDSDDR